MPPDYQKTEWFEVFQNLYSKWISIVVIAFTVAVIIAIYTLFIPNQYKSTANLLPNQKTNLGFNMLSEGGGLSSLAGSILGGGAEEADRYYNLLNSYTTKRSVVEEFNLIEVYDVSESDTPLINAMGILEERTQFTAQQTGNFIIEVWDTDPVRSKEMADFYVDHLNRLNTEISTGEAASFKEFAEERYESTLSQIEQTRNELNEFQERYGVFQLEDQVMQYFNLLGTVTAQQIETEIKLDFLENTVSSSNQQYRQTQLELESINNKLASLYQDENNENFILNFANLSDVGLTYAELVKKIEIQTEVLRYIVPLLEQARMEEVKALPIVSVLDEPVVPMKKSYPSRTLIVLLAGMTGVILACIYYTIKLSFTKNKPWFDTLTNKPE